MKDNKPIKTIFLFISFFVFLSACNLFNTFDLQPASTISPVPSKTLQSTPGQDATIAFVPSSTTSPATASPTTTTTSTVTVTATPTITSTATATSIAPVVLSWNAYSYTCDYAAGGTTMTMSLSWNDPSTNESGFRVYRNNVSIAALEPNSTSYVDISYIPAGNSVSYFIEIFNRDWQVRSSTITYACN